MTLLVSGLVTDPIERNSFHDRLGTRSTGGHKVGPDRRAGPGVCGQRPLASQGPTEPAGRTLRPDGTRSVPTTFVQSASSSAARSACWPRRPSSGRRGGLGGCRSAARRGRRAVGVGADDDRNAVLLGGGAGDVVQVEPGGLAFSSSSLPCFLAAANTASRSTS